MVYSYMSPAQYLLLTSVLGLVKVNYKSLFGTPFIGSLYFFRQSMLQEHQGRQLYYFMIASPQAIILSKTIYNTALTLVLALLGYLVFSVVFGNPVADHPLFLLNLLLGAIGFSAALTMVSAIASKAGNNGTLMAILSFPVMIPILLMTIQVSKSAIDGLDRGISAEKMQLFWPPPTCFSLIFGGARS